MPSVYLLRGVHPSSFFSDEYSPSDIIKAVSCFELTDHDCYSRDTFLNSITNAFEYISKVGGDLVLSDNCYIDYLSKDKPDRKTVFNILSQHYDISSVVLMDDPISIYNRICHNSFYGGDILSFDEVCCRLNVIMDDYSDVACIDISKFENNEFDVLEQITKELKLEFNNNYNLLGNVINKNANVMDFDVTNLENLTDLDTVISSINYSKLQSRFKPKDRKVILVASLPRSGSTWLYNCVRELYKIRNIDFYSSWIDDYDPSNAAKIHLVKVHNPEAKIASQADVVLSTRRDLRDICASLIRMGWLPQRKSHILSAVDKFVNVLHKYWNEIADLEIEYDNIVNNRNNSIRQVADAIGLCVEDTEVELISIKLDNLKAPKDKVDEETQLHPNHRSPTITNYKNVLEKDVLENINKTYSFWFEKYEYKI